MSLQSCEAEIMADSGSAGAVLITGAGGGAGAATARALVKKGFRVYAGVHSGAGDLDGVSGVQVIPLDVTDPASVDNAVEAVRTAGETELRGVVNNAGIIVQGPLELVPDGELVRQFEVNVFGPARVTQAFLPLLRQGRGRVVNITAATARVPGPFFGPISASKASLQALSDAWRVELAPWGISVVVIEPGALETQIFAKAAASSQKASAALPPEQVRRYSAQLDAVNAAMGKMKASSPSILSDAVVTALTAAKPKPRYTIGPDTRLLGLLARLPLRTRDRLLTQAMGLSKVRPADG
jgi:NAD(P)-dependent dehydrogenase (short-subunit alcohol dehydrogenase family)